ncbi:MAG: hypothetical protein ACRD5F_04085 [Candidatus Acidiferrales bacterium]
MNHERLLTPRAVLLRSIGLVAATIVVAYVLFSRATSSSFKSWELGLDLQASLLGAGFLSMMMLHGFKGLRIAFLVGATLTHFALSRKLNLLVPSSAEQLDMQAFRTVILIVVADLGLFATLVFFAPISEAKYRYTVESHGRLLRRFSRTTIVLISALIVAVLVRFAVLDPVPGLQTAASLQVTIHFVVIILWLLFAARIWLPEYLMATENANHDNPVRRNESPEKFA